MLFWLICAVLTAAVTIVTLRPILVGGPVDAATDQHDLELYKEQLADVERDLARGLISGDEAAAARLEISRRILAVASEAGGPSSVAGPTRFSQAVIYLSMGVIVALSLGLYLFNGAPGYSAQPFAARVRPAPETAPVAQLIARVEARLREVPEDGAGWDVLAPVYLKQQRFADAIRAYGRAIALLGENRARLRGLAEAHLGRSNGIVGDEVRAAYTKILAKEPHLVAPRFWLAVGLEQDGDRAAARAQYRALLEGGGDAQPLPPALAQLINERLAALTEGASGKTLPEAGKGPPAPSGMAEGMSARQQTEMIEQMMRGLAERLRANGGEIAEWQRLIRAYMVMGRKPQATEALAKARAQYGTDVTARRELEIFARELGMEPQ